MKKVTVLFLTIILSCIGIMVHAQKLYDIRLEPMEISPASKACYDIQLRSSLAQDLNLAGQNYRLYFDSEVLKFNEAFSVSYLPKDNYTDFMLNQEITGADASGVGRLDYESNLGFLNFSMDLTNVEAGGTILPADGKWINTTRICFDLQQGDKPPREGIHWARKDLTNTYATAFVEVVEWVAPYETVPAHPNEYLDLEATNPPEEVLEGIKIYPNPSVDHIMLELNQDGMAQLEIWDQGAKQVLSTSIDYQSAPYRIDIDQLPAGAYTLFIKVGEKSHFTIIEKIW
ncbi:MAG: T9SS type A sorting domain-containing protein [Bacteroidetes bacterium]|nr:T9SS type A sorting domain-containing protein [Bacteroidota bacterium]MDF1865366.1 hypothetical protein [Saprospiraceae bacterium]